MQELSDRSRSESHSISSGYDSGFESDFDVSGIDDFSYLRLYLESSKEDYKIINYVNSKSDLVKTAKQNGVLLQPTNKNDWAYKANCPFPDHRDSSPSFNINIQTNTFHCFGCSRKGGTCQFLACLHKKQTIEIAKDLLANKQVKIDELVKEAQQSYNDIISPYLESFSEIHFNFLKDNSFSEEAFEYASNVAPVFELYVKNILKNSNLDIDSLNLRLDFCKRKFEEFNF
jgi:hypothetical protein